MCLLRVAMPKPYFNIYTPFSQTTAILEPDLDGTYKLSAENRFNIRDTKSKRPLLNVIVAP